MFCDSLWCLVSQNLWLFPSETKKDYRQHTRLKNRNISPSSVWSWPFCMQVMSSSSNPILSLLKGKRHSRAINRLNNRRRSSWNLNPISFAKKNKMCHYILAGYFNCSCIWWTTSISILANEFGWIESYSGRCSPRAGGIIFFAVYGLPSAWIS